MKITIKLYGSFQEGRFDVRSRVYPEVISVADVLADLGLSSAAVGICVVNSNNSKKDDVLNDGDTLALFPMMSGG